MRVVAQLLVVCLFTQVCLATEPNGSGAEPCADEIAVDETEMGAITLAEAVAAALRYHPALSVADCEIQAAEGRILQAGVRPNPEVAIEVENFAGSGTSRGFEAAETTFQVSQLIELGDKRAKRVQLARSDRDLSEWGKKSRRLAVIADTHKAFIEVLGAQNRLAMAEDLATLASAVMRSVAAKVKAGKVSPIEEARVSVDASRANAEVISARHDLAATRARLALQWGAENARFERVHGRLDALPPLLAREDINRQIDRNPELARWSSELQRRGDALALSAATGIPDISVSGGVRQFAETDDVGVVIGVSIPLPIFDRNQGAIVAAQAKMAAADAARAAKRRELLAEVYSHHQVLITAAEEEASLRRDVLPLAKQVFEATTKGYQRGKFGLLEVLDAQRTLFESRGLMLDVQMRYHLAAVELERLLGTGVENPPATLHSNPGAQ